MAFATTLLFVIARNDWHQRDIPTARRTLICIAARIEEGMALKIARLDRGRQGSYSSILINGTL